MKETGKPTKKPSCLCQRCTRLKECRGNRAFAALMQYRTFCSRFDDTDKEPRLFPVLQPYEVEWRDAEYAFRKERKLPLSDY